MAAAMVLQQAVAGGLNTHLGSCSEQLSKLGRALLTTEQDATYEANDITSA